MKKYLKYIIAIVVILLVTILLYFVYLQYQKPKEGIYVDFSPTPTIISTPIVPECVDKSMDEYYEENNKYIESKKEENIDISIFKMDNAGYIFDECTFEKTPREKDVTEKIEYLHKDLNKKLLHSANGVLDNELFGNIFQHFSAYHIVIGSSVYSDGIIMITGAGNGTPPNYHFGYLYADDQNIILKEIQITDFFKNTPYEQYLDLSIGISMEESNKISNVLQEVEQEYNKQLINNKFDNPNIQAQYEEFINKIK